MSRLEFGKVCQKCRRKKESHMYPFPIRGKYLRICQVCWKLELAKRERGE